MPEETVLLTLQEDQPMGSRVRHDVTPKAAKPKSPMLTKGQTAVTGAAQGGSSLK